MSARAYQPQPKQPLDTDFLRHCMRRYGLRGTSPDRITLHPLDTADLPPSIDGVQVTTNRHVPRNTALVGVGAWEESE